MSKMGVWLWGLLVCISMTSSPRCVYWMVSPTGLLYISVVIASQLDIRSSEVWLQQESRRQRGRVVRALDCRVQVPLWPLAGFEPGSPWFNPSAALVHSHSPCKKTKTFLSQVQKYWTKFNKILKIGLLKKLYTMEWSITRISKVLSFDV